MRQVRHGAPCASCELGAPRAECAGPPRAPAAPGAPRSMGARGEAIAGSAPAGAPRGRRTGMHSHETELTSEFWTGPSTARRGTAPGPQGNQQRAPSAHWPAGRGATVAGTRRGGEGARVGLGSTWEARHGWAAQIGRPIRWRPGGCPAEPAETGDWDVRAASNKTCGGGSRAEPTERATGTAHLRAPCHGRLRGARLQDTRDPTRPAACPRRARDLPAAAHARPRRGPTGLRRPGCAAGRGRGPPAPG